MPNPTTLQISLLSLLATVSNHLPGSILSISNLPIRDSGHIWQTFISGISGISGIQGLLLHWGYYDILSIPADFRILTVIALLGHGKVCYLFLSPNLKHLFFALPLRPNLNTMNIFDMAVANVFNYLMLQFPRLLGQGLLTLH